MKNHHLLWFFHGFPTFPIVFLSFSVHYLFSYSYPMVFTLFLWFSRGFPMVFATFTMTERIWSLPRGRSAADLAAHAEVRRMAKVRPGGWQMLGEPWENHGKSGENPRKTMGKWWFYGI